MTSDREPPALYLEYRVALQELMQILVNEGKDLNALAFVLHRAAASGLNIDYDTREKMTEAIAETPDILRKALNAPGEAHIGGTVPVYVFDFLATPPAVGRVDVLPVSLDACDG